LDTLIIDAGCTPRATVAMPIGTLLGELERRDLKHGLATMCTAGGMAPGIIIERV
jgi:acetyl-CoA C-acetyltransferase